MTTAVKSLTCREVKAVQETLGQFIPLPWHYYDEITALPANGPEILEQTLRELRALNPAVDRPDLAENLRQSAISLQSLRESLHNTRLEQTGQYSLNPEQVELYCQAWQNLEKVRRDLAVTMFDDLEPFIGVIDTDEIQPGGLNLSVDTSRKFADSLYEEHLANQRKS